MPRMVNGKPLRVKGRGGRLDRPSRITPPTLPDTDRYPNGHPMSYEPRDSAPSSTGTLQNTAAPYWEQTHLAEQVSTHGEIIRKSVTDSQHLGLNAPIIETESRKARQLLTPNKLRKVFKDSKWNPTTAVRVKVRKPIDPCRPNLGTKVVEELHLVDGALVETSDERVTFQGPKTLLKRGKPVVSLRGKFKRQEHYTKTIRTVPNEEPLPDGLGEGMIVTTEHESLDLERLGIDTGHDDD